MADQSDLQRTIDILLTATDDTAPGLDEAEERLRTFQQKMARIREQDAKDAAKAAEGGVLGQLKGGLGGRSDFKEYFELLKGGGAVAGLSFAGSAINDFVQGAVQLRDELAAGKIEAGELVEKLAGSVPVYGQIWQAGRGIRELITGERAEVERLNAEHEATNKFLEARLRLQQMSKDIAADQADTIRKLNNEIRALSLPEGRDRDIELNRQAYEGRGAGIAGQLAAAMKRIDEERQKARSPIEAALATAQAQAGTVRNRIGGIGEQEGDRVRLREMERDAEVIASRLVKVDADAEAARRAARERAAAATRLSAEKFIREEQAITRKAREQDDKEAAAAAEKAREAAAKAREQELKDYEAFRKRQRETFEKSQREAETVNSRVDASLRDFFDFESMTEATAPDVRRPGGRRGGGGGRSNFVGTAQSEIGGTLAGYAGMSRERAALMGSDPDMQFRQEQARRDEKRNKLQEDGNKKLDRVIQLLAPTSGGVLAPVD